MPLFASEPYFDRRSPLRASVSSTQSRPRIAGAERKISYAPIFCGDHQEKLSNSWKKRRSTRSALRAAMPLSWNAIAPKDPQAPPREKVFHSTFVNTTIGTRGLFPHRRFFLPVSLQHPEVTIHSSHSRPASFSSATDCRRG